MSSLFKRPFNLILIPIISAPHFLLGCLLVASNWRSMGYPARAKNTIKWGLIGTIFIFITAFSIPMETLKKMWPVGIGINIGVGMALRTFQTPEYEKAVNKTR